VGLALEGHRDPEDQAGPGVVLEPAIPQVPDLLPLPDDHDAGAVEQGRPRHGLVDPEERDARDPRRCHSGLAARRETASELSKRWRQGRRDASTAGGGSPGLAGHLLALAVHCMSPLAIRCIVPRPRVPVEWAIVRGSCPILSARLRMNEERGGNVLDRSGEASRGGGRCSLAAGSRAALGIDWPCSATPIPCACTGETSALARSGCSTNAWRGAPGRRRRDLRPRKPQSPATGSGVAANQSSG
jgi:hypothetical protein